MHKPILVLDFDGVIHSYTSGWLGPTGIPDLPVEGAADACREYLKHFDVRVVSSRCKYPGGPDAIRSWLNMHGFPPEMVVSDDGSKPAAFVSIDDRAITFEGVWPDVNDLLFFKPWNK